MHFGGAFVCIDIGRPSGTNYPKKGSKNYFKLKRIHLMLQFSASSSWAILKLFLSFYEPISPGSENSPTTHPCQIFEILNRKVSSISVRFGLFSTYDIHPNHLRDTTDDQQHTP
jgi:hypothetical protein